MTGGLVRNCLFTNNTAIFGGGVYMTAGMVSNCLFIKNPTKSGGGASGRGGAVYMNGGTLSDSRILNNTSVRAGAGVLINGGKMERCFVYGNNAGHGGGGVAMEGAATLENCLIVSNMSGYYSGGGGGVLMLAAGRVVHCTVVSNRTTTVGLGGGIYRGSAVNGVVTNTIIWRNSTDSGVSNNVCTINPTNFFRYCSFPELPADLGISGNITNEPVFGPALTLAAGSPGIDSGITLPGVAVDLTGALRPRDGNQDRQAVSDMGAYEYWDSRPRGSLLIIR
jgi:predicted outer membrane repeat protein